MTAKAAILEQKRIKMEAQQFSEYEINRDTAIE